MRIAKSVVQDAGLGMAGQIAEAIQCAASLACFTVSRVSVAYATARGVEEYRRRIFANNEGLRKGRKRWLVSFDYGQTEPDAVEKLAALPNSKVRIPNATFVLARKLFPLASFHPKTFVFGELPGQRRLSAVAHVSGSANLTYGGLIANVEHAIIFGATPVSSADVDIEQSHAGLVSWFDAAWSRSEDLNEQLLRRYRDLRRRVLPILADDEDLASSLVINGTLELNGSDAARWATARYFWIETAELYKNRGVGRAGNQLDCRRGTRVYFGFPATVVPRNTVLGTVTLQYLAGPAQARSVRFGDNMMDKVNLPIPSEFGPSSYDHKVLHFERLDRQAYVLSAGSEGEIRRWKAKSRAQGMHYRFARGREYGFYS
jgi:HKD family nuclease